MKILFILENYIPHIGGVEIVFKNLSEGLAKLGHDVSIITHRPKGTKKFEILGGVKVYRVDCFHSRYWFTFLSIPQALKLARTSDIIHTTTFNAAFPAWLVSRIIGKPSIITVHEVWVGAWNRLTEMNWLNAKLHSFLERLIYLLRFNKYACVSKSTQQQLIDAGVSKSRSVVIYNGVDYLHWNPKKYDGKKVRKHLGIEKNFVYLFSGRPGISKGLEYLLKAVPVISKKIPDSKLLALVSKDKAYKKRYSYISRMIKSLGIQDSIILHDPVAYKELPSYVRAADCIVVPSLSEGFGFAVAEACAMGKPVVASDTTSIPEVVSGKYVLVKPKDEKSIAEGVIDVYNGRFKKSSLKKFTDKEFISRYIKEYQTLV